MKTMLGPRRHHYLARVSTLLIAVALIAGTVGCPPPPAPQYELAISSTEGGSVTAPGQGTFAYDEGTVVNLLAEAEEGYQFVNWTGDAGTIASVNATATTITMNGDYSITARFVAQPELRTTGAFLDEVLVTKEPDPSAAVQQLKNDVLDIYALGPTDASLYSEILADPNLTSVESVGVFNDFTFNPVGPTFPATGKLNPFSVPEFREAMHWLVDRDYIAGDIAGALAVPRYTCLNDNFADAKERYPDLIAAVEAKYAHDPTKAEAVITEEVGNLGAVLEGGKWMYNGEPVELIFLIRTEDERKDIGDYYAGLLEGLGFTMTRQYGTFHDLTPLWLYGDPGLGTWHIYTGGWIDMGITRDEGETFGFFYTTLGYAWMDPLLPLWQAYVNDPAFYEAAEKLWNGGFATMAERRALFETCLEYSMKENQRMFLSTRRWFTPMRENVRVAHDLAGGVSGSWMWALTAHFVDDEDEPIVGGTLRVATPDILTNPWNPVAGSSSWPNYDMFPIRATGDMGLQPDTRTGLRWAGRIEKAEVFVQTGLPVGVTNTDWCSLSFVPEIQVPLDAWADWDAAEQRFITVAERFPEGTTAARKSVSYYPDDIFDVPLHDGSSLSMGDFILYAILLFDRAKEESAIYDESYVAEFDAFISAFKGVRFITDNPDYGLIVEYYSDQWELDAELAITTMFPVYSQGPGMWHTIALGIRAEEDKALAFSQAKSTNLEVLATSTTASTILHVLFTSFSFPCFSCSLIAS
ncbi:MAG: hypothetical protein E3J25_04760, partial [Anaerolineales bacterium]